MALLLRQRSSSSTWLGLLPWSVQSLESKEPLILMAMEFLLDQRELLYSTVMGFPGCRYHHHAQRMSTLMAKIAGGPREKAMYSFLPYRLHLYANRCRPTCSQPSRCSARASTTFSDCKTRPCHRPRRISGLEMSATRRSYPQSHSHC